MACCAHKRVERLKLGSFPKSESEREEEIALSWKQAPHMAHTKLNGTSITYWQNKGTLMFQGRNETTHQMNKRFIERRWLNIGGLPPANRVTTTECDRKARKRRANSNEEMNAPSKQGKVIAQPDTKQPELLVSTKCNSTKNPNIDQNEGKRTRQGRQCHRKMTHLQKKPKENPQVPIKYYRGYKHLC